MNDDFNLSIDPDARNDITRRILQAVTGELPVKQALDTAGNETTEFLKGHGYYK